MLELMKEGYINQQEFNRFLSAYEQYIDSQNEKMEKAVKDEIDPIQLSEGKELIPRPVKSEKKPNPPKVKQANDKTPEQIRERNITWLLVIGVVFLLISGLVVATSTWEQMGALLKVLTLIGVSVFFLVLSAVCSSFLKIEKTAFAFLTLGSLLLPIAIIAIGYFGLFGEYLTLTGEGRYLLGVICTLLPLPLYARNAMKNNSRLFVWIFYLFLSFFIGFTIASGKVSVDVYYFLMMIFNGALLYGYHRLRDQNSIRIFIRELPAYAQLNLVISTIMMLFVFDHMLFYSFNILVTAILYIAMIFVYNTKDYHLIFSALFAYGIYQLTENSVLHSIDLFVYSLIGAAYLGFAYLTKKDSYLKSVFHYTSAIMSLCAFLYISYQGILLRSQDDSWILLLAYITIVCTYTYLSNISQINIFRWLAAVFLFVSGLQLWDLAFEPKNLSAQLFMFIYAVIIFTTIGLRNKIKFLSSLNVSAYYVSIVVMILTVMYGLVVETYIQVFLMFVIMGFLSLLVFFSQSEQYKQVAVWFNAICWWFAMFVLYPELIGYSSTYMEIFNVPFHLALSGVILLLISLLWKKSGWSLLENASFYIGQLSYLLAVLLLTDLQLIDPVIVRPVILLIGVGVSVWFVRYTRLEIAWLAVSILSLAFYISLISTFSITGFASVIWFVVFAPVLLLIADRYAGIYAEGLKPYFFWLAHAVQFFIMLLIVLDQLVVHQLNPIILFIPLTVYIYSTLIGKVEWQVKLFLYAGLSVIPVLLAGYSFYFKLTDAIPFAYYFIISSVIMVLVWFTVPLLWKRRIDWYIVPFSIVSLITVVALGPISTPAELVVVISFVILILYLLHKRKWMTLLLFPLLLSILVWDQQTLITPKMLTGISIVCFFVLLIAGRVLYAKLCQKVGEDWFIDWYSFIALAYVGYAASFIGPENSVWIKILPYMLLALWLAMQIKRIDHTIWKKSLVTLAVICLLPIYYHILFEYISYINPLFHAELIALPVMFLSIAISKKVWNDYRSAMTNLQTVILAGITVYLVYDAIQSQTIWDALIIGTLSIVSLLAGMKFHIKSYLFTGLATLIFNVIYQTKPYWGNLPWWVYLLVAGITFISVASYNEWKKQRKAEGQFVKKMKEIVAQLKEWD